MFYLKIAFLNIFRNFRRTFITLCAIVFGSVSLIVFGGFVSGMYEGLRESMIRSNLGHFQVYAEGFSENHVSEPQDYMLSPDKTEKLREILESYSEVVTVSERLNFSGLLGNGSVSLGIIGKGVDPDAESSLTASVKIVDGADLYADDTDGILIGEELAQALKAKSGDVLTLLVNSVDGVINAADVRVIGIVSTGFKELDARLLQANLPFVQDLMYTQEVTRLAVLLEVTEETPKIIERFHRDLNQAGLKVEIKSWSELADFYHKVVSLFNSIFGFINIIVAVIVILSIVNTMIMSVMERTSEIGSIRAIGATQGEILFLFITETFYLGIIGGILGVLAGIGMAELISAAGFIMPPPPGNSQGFPIRIFTESEILWNAFVISVISALISGIYPAIKASRLSIVDALRYI